MPFTVGPIRDLAKALTECADAIEKGDPGQTKLQVQHLKRVAELLAIDPDFERIYKQSEHRCDGPDPRAALDCMAAFLGCVADVVTKRSPYRDDQFRIKPS